MAENESYKENSSKSLEFRVERCPLRMNPNIYGEAQIVYCASGANNNGRGDCIYGGPNYKNCKFYILQKRL